MTIKRSIGAPSTLLIVFLFFSRPVDKEAISSKAFKMHQYPLPMNIENSKKNQWIFFWKKKDREHSRYMYLQHLLIKQLIFSHTHIRYQYTSTAQRCSLFSHSQPYKISILFPPCKDVLFLLKENVCDSHGATIKKRM